MTDGQIPLLRRTIRWRVFGPVLLVGLALTATALFTSIRWKWNGIWPAAFLDFGATILLGALLYVVQQSFVYAVRVENRAVIERVDARANQLTRQIEEQSTRIDTLSEDVDRLREVRHAQLDDSVAKILQSTTYEAISEALRNAERMGATSDLFRVRASANLDGPRLHFMNVYLMGRGGPDLPQLSLTLEWLDHISEADSWSPGEDAATVMDRLVAKLEAANLDSSVDTFDSRLAVENLAKSLELALKSQRGQLPRRLRGPLIEMVDDRWVFTDAGLESLVGDTFTSADLFPATLRRFQSPGTPPFKPPEAPRGVPDKTWSILMRIAEFTYIGRDRPVRRKGLLVDRKQ